MKKTFYLLAICISLNLNTFAQGKLQGLMTESTVTPLGIDEQKPKFTWQMSAPDRGYKQVAYQIEVSDTKGVISWNSKKITSGVSLNVPYSGKALKPTTRYN